MEEGFIAAVSCLSSLLLTCTLGPGGSTMPGAPKCEPVFDLIAERVKKVGKTCRQLPLCSFDFKSLPP